MAHGDLLAIRGKEKEHARVETEIFKACRLQVGNVFKGNREVRFGCSGLWRARQLFSCVSSVSEVGGKYCLVQLK